jgi:hypothetical protein
MGMEASGMRGVPFTGAKGLFWLIFVLELARSHANIVSGD